MYKIVLCFRAREKVHLPILMKFRELSPNMPNEHILQVLLVQLNIKCDNDKIMNTVISTRAYNYIKIHERLFKLQVFMFFHFS